MRRGRAVWGLVLGLAAYLLVRVFLTAGSGADTTGSYTLLEPGVAYPCAPIHYVVSAAEAPPDFVQVVHGAIGKVSAASGYRFFFDGMTSDRDFASRVSGPVLIGFGATHESSQFEDGAIGVGGSAYNSSGRYVTGHVLLDATKYADQHDLADRQAIVMHELAHVLGLGHVKDRHELMNPTYVGQKKFGPGDLAGLHRQFALSCPAGAS